MKQDTNHQQVNHHKNNTPHKPWIFRWTMFKALFLSIMIFGVLPMIALNILFYDNFMQEVEDSGRLFFMSLVIVTIISVAGVWLVSGRISSPLAYLIKQMKEVEGGRTDVSTTVRGHGEIDEVKELFEGFNNMVKSLQELSLQNADGVAELAEANRQISCTNAQLKNQFDKLKVREKALEDSRQIYQLALAVSNVGIVDSIVDEHVITISRWLEEYLGSKVNNMADFFMLIHDDDRLDYVHRLMNLNRDEDSFNQELRLKVRGGIYEWFEAGGAALFDENGRVVRFLGSVKDIQGQKLAQEKIHRIAHTDHLTSLPNRRAYFNKIEQLIMDIEVEQVALLYIDIDNFKTINDTLGHEYGDKLLQDIAKRLVSTLHSDTAFIARLGGDEFVVVLSAREDIGRVDMIAHSISDDFRIPYILKRKEYYIGASIGIAISQQNELDPNVLITKADAAMYNAKAIGKNMICHYHTSMHDKLIQEMKMEEELRKAIDHQDFTLFYQVQVDLRTGKVCGFESLLRWMHTSEQMILPMDFIPLAEKTGLIVRLGEWVLEESCRQAKEWIDAGYSDFTMGVNLSARQFKDKQIVETVSSAMKKADLDPKHLDLELTETIALDDIDYTIETINEIKSYGVQFSLDDFGTGYSSMNYLKMLPFDNVKIDKSFVDNIVENKDEQAIVKAVITMVHALKLNVITEGIEYKEQERMISKYHCDRAQGYLYSKPLAAADAFQLLKKSHDSMNV